MLTAVVTRVGHSVEVTVLNAADGEEESHSDVAPKDGPSPIVPELKELAWGAGAFIVFAVLMRLVLYPKVKQGMEARYSKIHTDEELADTARASARAEVAEYEGQLASVRAEAHERVNNARQQLEAERAERLAAVNAEIDERRRSALAAASADREAGRTDAESAAADVLARTVELAIGKPPAADVVRDAVSAAMMEGAGR